MTTVVGEKGRLHSLLELFERLRERPKWWEGRRLRPLLLLLGTRDQTLQVAEVFDQRCLDQRAPLSRIGAVDGQAGAGPGATGLPEVLREAGRELSRRRCRPRAEPALRFPLLDMALWLRDLNGIRRAGTTAGSPEQDSKLVGKLGPADEELRRKLLRRAMRQRGRDRPREHGDRGRFATFLAYLEQVAPIGVAVVALVSATAASTLDLAAAALAAVLGLSVVAGEILARSRGWYGTLRFRWFRAQPYLGGAAAPDFLSFALDAIMRHGPDEHGNDDEFDLLQVAAFLEDLRRNYRRDVRRAAWARVRYPVLVFDHLSAGHPGRAFITTVERVRAGREAERPPGFDPLVIVAGIDPDTRERHDAPNGPSLADAITKAVTVPVSDARADLGTAAGLWPEFTREQRRAGALGGRRVLSVRLTAMPAEQDLDRQSRGRPWLTHPAMPWMVMMVVLSASAGLVIRDRVGNCGSSSVPRDLSTGVCVGVTDGSYVFDKRLRNVEQRIKASNDEVVASGKPYVTIVYIGPMTSDKSGPEGLLAGAEGELVGISIAQRRQNDSGAPLRLRVLLANAGEEMAHAGKVARRVRELARHDPRIVGVVGFVESRRQTQQAIDELSRSALPMISTANSYDRTGWRPGGYSPYLFRLAPPNRRLAGHAAYWAQHGQLDLRARSAVVLYDSDPNDLYSRNLAQDFAASFHGKVSTLPYTDAGNIPGTVRSVCAHPPDVFYYAGRSNEFGVFVNELRNTSCGRQRVVLGNDEITRYVSDHAAEIGANDSIRLYFTPLATKEAWTYAWVGAGQPLQRFFGEYDRYDSTETAPAGRADVSDHQPSPTHAALANDAVVAVTSAAGQVFGNHRVLPTPAALLTALIEPDEGAALQGASGVLMFGPRSVGHQIPRKPVLLARVRSGGDIDVREVCGELVQGPRERPKRQAHCPPG